LVEEYTLWRGDAAEIPLEFDVTPGTEFELRPEYGAGLRVELFWVKPVLAYVGRGYGKNDDWNKKELKESVPDILYKGEPSFVPDDGRLELLLHIAAPKHTIPGSYEITLKLRLGKASLERLILVRVLERVLPQEGFSLELWQYPYTLNRYYNSTGFGEQAAEHLRLYRRAGGNILTATICENPWNGQTYDPYPSMVKWRRGKGGGFTFDYTDFDAWVCLARDCGITGAIKCFSLLPWGDRLRYFDEASGGEKEISLRVGGKRWREVWTAFLHDFIAHLEENAWFGRVYIAVDERPANVTRKALRFLRQFKSSAGERLKISCAINLKRAGLLPAREADDISIEQRRVPLEGSGLKKIIAERRERGQTTTIYTCGGNYPNSFVRSVPEESEWCVWYAFAQGADGFLRWALDAWNENPLEDASYRFWESGDCFLLYPQQLSRRFLLLAQGVRGVRKARYLLEYGSEETKKSLRALLANMRRPAGVTNAQGAFQGDEEGRLIVLEDLKRLHAAIGFRR
jgi:hypothetical protein